MKKICAYTTAYANVRNSSIECCLNNIGFYIIQKIREEDFREDKNIMNLEESDETKKLIEEEIKSKINIAEMILNNRDILMNLEDFYEEDCQFSLLNWACDIHKRIKRQRSSMTCLTLDYNEKINKDFFKYKNSLINNMEILLYNILNIFEIFPIKPDDLKSLNFIEKLKDIKKEMKIHNRIIYKKIKNLIKFWKSMIKIFDKQKAKLLSEKNIINKKRQREDDETAKKEKNEKDCGFNEDNDISSSNLSLYETETCEHNEIKKKKVSWKNDDILVDKMEYDPNNPPYTPVS